MFEYGPPFRDITGIDLDSYAREADATTDEEPDHITALAHINWAYLLRDYGLVLLIDGSTLYRASEGYTVPPSTVISRYRKSVNTYLRGLGFDIGE